MGTGGETVSSTPVPLGSRAGGRADAAVCPGLSVANLEASNVIMHAVAAPARAPLTIPRDPDRRSRGTCTSLHRQAAPHQGSRTRAFFLIREIIRKYRIVAAAGTCAKLDYYVSRVTRRSPRPFGPRPNEFAVSCVCKGPHIPETATRAASTRCVRPTKFRFGSIGIKPARETQVAICVTVDIDASCRSIGNRRIGLHWASVGGIRTRAVSQLVGVKRRCTVRIAH